MRNKETRKRDDLISVVIVASQIQCIDLGETIKSISLYLNNNYADYEILIVSDIPKVFPKAVLNELLRAVPSIRIIELSFQVSYDVAITVGLENSIGDYVYIYNPTQDPIELITMTQDKCNKDVEIVVGVDNSTKNTLAYRIIRPFVNKLLDEIGYNLPKNSTTFRCLTRNAVNSATKARNHHHQILVRISNCGLDIDNYEYKVKAPELHKKGLIGGVKDTLNLLIFNSTKPLRWMSVMGVLGSLFALLFALYSFILHFVNDNIADGWSSTVILISMLFMLLFVIMIFFGEYLGRLLNDQSRHDSYWVTNEQHSSVMVDVDRPNVVFSSENSD